MTNKGLFKVVSLIALITILSKIAGFVRDLVVADAYGASIITDAYFYAYQIPSLALVLLGGLGGPFHTATIAVFGKRLIDKNAEIPQHENDLLNAFLTYTILGFFIVSLIVAIFALPITKVMTYGASPELQKLTADMLLIMTPILIIGGLIGIFYGILNIYENYFWPTISPLIASLVLIAFIGFGGKQLTPFALAIATLLGDLGMLIVQLPGFFKYGFKIKPNFNYKLDGIGSIKELLFPAMIGTTIGQINIYVDMFFVSALSPGSWTAIVYSNRLIQLPIGVLITAMLVPIFPMFTTFVAKKEFDNLRYYARSSVISLWFISMPTLIFILIFSVDGVRILLERGQFDRQDTELVALALSYLAISIIPYMARDTVTRIFYAFDDSKTPLMVGLAAIIIKAIMDWLLVRPLGVGGITLSTTIVTFFNMIMLTILIRLKIRDISLRTMIKPSLKIIAAGLVLTGLCLVYNYLWNLYMPDTALFVLIKLIVIGIAGFAIYTMVTVMLGLDESKRIVDKFVKVVIRK